MKNNWDFFLSCESRKAVRGLAEGLFKASLRKSLIPPLLIKWSQRTHKQFLACFFKYPNPS